MKFSNLLATCFCLLGLFVVTTSFAADNVVITAKAREHFKAGVAYIEDPTGPKYEEAYREFHLAYAESPTYKILTNVGLCSLNLERDGEAIDAYTKFLASAKPEDIPKDKRTLMERDIAMLKASLVRITVTASPATLVLSDERLPTKGSSVTNRYELSDGNLALGIHPGHHRITASADGYEPQNLGLRCQFRLHPRTRVPPEAAHRSQPRARTENRRQSDQHRYRAARNPKEKRPHLGLRRRRCNRGVCHRSYGVRDRAARQKDRLRQPQPSRHQSPKSQRSTRLRKELRPLHGHCDRRSRVVRRSNRNPLLHFTKQQDRNQSNGFTFAT